jgi:hypothetical protein
MPRRRDPDALRVVCRTARIGLRTTAGQRRRCFGLLRSIGDLWACVLEANWWRRRRGVPADPGNSLLMVIDLPAIVPRPRPVLLRLTYTVVIVAALFSVPWLASEAGRRIGGRPWAHWPSPTLVLLVLGALVASRVPYRWFDAFLLLIPIVGMFYLWRFAWRLSFLPYRDWPPRPEEAPSWRKVAHPDRPGAGLYLVDRTGQRERPDGS